MRTIRKGSEPRSLTLHRLSGNATYNNYQDKETLRSALVTEQRGLCCFCLSRIRADGQQMKIVHARSQSMAPTEQLDYTNLLAACKGNEGQPRKSQHCDTRQGNRHLTWNPADAEHSVEVFVHFSGDGRIFSRDSVFDNELNQVLNLNFSNLVNNRKATLDAFLQAFRKDGGLSLSTLEKWLKKWSGESTTGDLQPFCQVIVYWIQKRMNRA